MDIRKCGLSRMLRNVQYWAHIIMDARLRKMDDRLSIKGCRLWITKA